MADIKNILTQIPPAALQTIVQHTPFHPENPNNESYYPNADSDAPGCYVATCINSDDTILNRDQIRQPANILTNPPHLKQVLSPRWPGGDTAKRCQVLRQVWLSDLTYTSNSLEFPYILMYVGYPDDVAGRAKHSHTGISLGYFLILYPIPKPSDRSTTS